MTRLSNKLSARKVETLKESGRYSDGNGLYLRITPESKRWTFMFTWTGKRVEIGLGSARDVSLAAAREKAQACREWLDKGIDPRNPPKPQSEAEPIKIPTFGECADEFISGMEGDWKNEKHRDQWRMTLSRPAARQQKKKPHPGYCRPLINKPVNEIVTEDVLAVLRPIWLKKPETATRVRGRIEAVLSAAKSLGYRTGENPAAWRDNLKNLLPKPKKLSRGHHAAMHYHAIAAFYATVTANPTISNLALAWTILTAARSGETMGATWQEIDRDARLWRIPKERMKAGREHLVPLTDAAILILDAVEKHRKEGVDLVFPGTHGKQLSVMALAMALRRAGGGDYTVHGMRSTFRDWCGDETSFQRDDVELCLAHTIRDETERAYRRSDALKKRAEIMQTWARYLTGQNSDNIRKLSKTELSA